MILEEQKQDGNLIIMGTNKTYRKSLKLLDVFIKKTPKAEIDALIHKHEDTNIKGPTVKEYLGQFIYCKYRKT